MFSSKNKLTEDQLREGILSKILGAILDKRVSKVLSVADIENNPALKRAVRNADKAVKQLDKTLQGNDHYHAMDPEDLKQYIKNIIKTTELLGNEYNQ